MSWQRRWRRRGLPFWPAARTLIGFVFARSDGVHPRPAHRKSVFVRPRCFATEAAPPIGHVSLCKLRRFSTGTTAARQSQSWQDDSKKLCLRLTDIRVIRRHVDNVGSAPLVSNFKRHRLTGAYDSGILAADPNPIAGAPPAALTSNTP